MRTLCALALVAGFLGCASKSQPQAARPTTRPVLVERPIIDFGRGGGGLPLEGVEELDSREALVGGLVRGFVERLKLPSEKSAITALGDWPNLSVLRIDLSDGRMKSAYRPRQFRKSGEVVQSVAVETFEYIARPLWYDNGPMQWYVRATDAKLGLLRDEKRGSTLVLTDAAEGELEFSVRRADLKGMMVGGSRAHAGGGFSVRNVELALSSEGPKSLEAELKVSASWLFFPATFSIQGRADIDEKFNVHLSKLACKGEDVGGALLAGFIDGRMKRHNGKVLPLVRFPGNRIEIIDGGVELDEHLRVKLRFGNRTNLAAK